MTVPGFARRGSSLRAHGFLALSLLLLLPSRALASGSQEVRPFTVDGGGATGMTTAPTRCRRPPASRTRTGPAPAPDSRCAGASGLLRDFGGSADLVLVGTRDAEGDGRFHALRLADGSVAWTFDGGSGGSIGIVSGMAQVDTAAGRVWFTSRLRSGPGRARPCGASMSAGPALPCAGRATWAPPMPRPCSRADGSGSAPRPASSTCSTRAPGTRGGQRRTWSRPPTGRSRATSGPRPPRVWSSSPRTTRSTPCSTGAPAPCPHPGGARPSRSRARRRPCSLPGASTSAAAAGGSSRSMPRAPRPARGGRRR